ncbi:MAG: hypothetical protein LUF30_12455 [Lachnospiraceae bacterium]|nr:hypothetical protein [Lachnospiraceae bacterium]
MGIRANALYEKLPYALEMAEEILTSRFDDDKRLYEIIARMESRLSMQQASAGHQTASLRAMSYFSPFCAFNDTIGGIAFYNLIADLEKHFDEKKDALKAKLRELMGLLFRRENLFVSVTADTEGLAALRAPLAAFVRSLPSAEAETEAAADDEGNVADMADGEAAVAGLADGEADESAKSGANGTYDEASGETRAVTNEKCAMTGKGLVLALEKKNEGFTTPGQVQYVARAGNFKKAGFTYTGALNVLKVLMSYEYLWVNIRVKGGAYGAMCGFYRRGDSYLASYRDPNLRGTNEVFEGIPAYLEKFDADEHEMTKYIIGAISDMDTPLTPAMQGSRSLNAYFAKLTDEQVQQERDEVLTVTPEKIRALAPLVQAVLDENAICVVGNEQKIKEAGDLFYSVKPLSGAL